MPRVRHAKNQPVTPQRLIDGLPVSQNDTPTRLSAELGPCVYAVRTPDRLVKIGFTTDLNMRIRQFGCVWSDVLLVINGDRDYEAALHGRFRKYVARGNEYYFPTVEIMAWINTERALFGISPAA